MTETFFPWTVVAYRPLLTTIALQVWEIMLRPSYRKL